MKLCNSEVEFRNHLMDWTVYSKTAEYPVATVAVFKDRQWDLVFVGDMPMTYRIFCMVVVRAINSNAMRMGEEIRNQFEAEWLELLDLADRPADNVSNLVFKVKERLKKIQRALPPDMTNSNGPLAGIVTDVERQLIESLQEIEGDDA